MHDEIERPIHAFSAAWAERDGGRMAACFTDDAHFVAYDGTRLRGGQAIGAWHQPALDTVLRGTTLDVRVDEVRMLTPDLALVLGSGGPVDEAGSERSRLAGDSYETFLVTRVGSGDWRLCSLQVTRRRPLRDAADARIWQDFNASWVRHKLG